MDYGIAIFLTDETIGPAHLARLVSGRTYLSIRDERIALTKRILADLTGAGF